MERAGKWSQLCGMKVLGLKTHHPLKTSVVFFYGILLIFSSSNSVTA